MRSSLIISGVLHIAIFLIAVLGLPYLPKREMLELAEIPVDVVEMGPMTIARLQDQPMERPRPQPPKPTPPKDVPPPPPQAQEKPEPPPPIKEPEPPKPEPPKPEPPKPPPPKEEPKPEPPKPEPPKPEPKKEEPKKPEPPKPEPPKPEPPKPEPKKEEPKRSLSDVLKNLEKQKPAPSETKPEPKQQVAEAPSGAMGPAGDRLTVSEKDALRNQMARCWAVPAGAKDVHKMRVILRVRFDAQFKVTGTAEVVKTFGSMNDPAYRGFVESAYRATQKPQCATLLIPPDKYPSGGYVEIDFSPEEMF